MGLDALRQFFKAEIWATEQDNRWSDWAKRVQTRRNAVHAYRNRDIGSFAEFFEDLLLYADFLRDMKDQLPYPDFAY
jgi:hypothetical protein